MGHSDENKYIDCFRCQRHPGAPPDHFGGTQPDDSDPVPTADEIGVPWPEQEQEIGHDLDHDQYRPADSAIGDTTFDFDEYNLPRGASVSVGHGRSLSQDSADPLQWSPERYQKETTDIPNLTQGLDRLGVQEYEYEISSEDATWVETSYTKSGRIRFENAKGKEVKTEQSEWVRANVDFGEDTWPCLLYVVPNSAEQFYTWRFGAGDRGADSSASVGRKGKEKKGKKKGEKKHKH